MANARWYTTREAVERAHLATEASLPANIDRIIAGSSARIERATNRKFYPLSKTMRLFWPYSFYNLYREDPTPHERYLLMPEDVAAITSIVDDDTDDTIPATDYRLEAEEDPGPPFYKLVWIGTREHPRNLVITGRFGYSEDTEDAGELSSALTVTASELTCSNEAEIGVGDTILVDEEAMFVRGKTPTAATTLTAALEVKSDVMAHVADGSAINPGQLLLVDSETMLVQYVAGNDLTVERAYGRSVLASHAVAAAVNAFSTLRVTRGANGTTAATHEAAAPIARYVPPADITSLCLALSIGERANIKGDWTGVHGTGEAAVESRGFNLREYRDNILRSYRRPYFGRV